MHIEASLLDLEAAGHDCRPHREPAHEPAPDPARYATSSGAVSRRPPAWWGLLPPLALLLGLELAVRAGWIAGHLLPAPSSLLQTLLDLGWPTVATHVGASTVRVALGFAIGASAGVALGAGVGLSRRLEALFEPGIQGLRAIPSLAWVPLLLLWLGIDEAPKLTLIAIGAFFPVYMGVSSGLRDVDRRLVEVARLAGLGPWGLTRRVLLPAALPAVMTGLRNGLSLAWMFMVAAELIATTRGLGYLLTDGRETGRADLVLVAIGLLAVLGKGSDTVMAALERRWLHWRDSFVAA